MNNIDTLHFPVSSDPISGQAAIHPDCRYDVILPGSLNHVTDADLDLKSGVIGADRINIGPADILVVKPVYVNQSQSDKQRFDKVWDISRKKMIKPTQSRGAPAWPRWQSISLHCQTAQEL